MFLSYTGEYQGLKGQCHEMVVEAPAHEPHVLELHR
jgi:hypothetical protein